MALLNQVRTYGTSCIINNKLILKKCIYSAVFVERGGVRTASGKVYINK
jgi:hypothetical protein